MKHLKRILVLQVLLLVVVSMVPVSAITPYSTYTYDIDGEYMESPHAFVPYKIVDYKSMGLDTELLDPEDVHVRKITDDSGNVTDYQIFISDTGNKRVVVTDSDFKTIAIIDSFINEWGVPDSINDPRGIYVAYGKLYICDCNSNRILVFNAEASEDGTYSFDFIKTLEEPKGDVFSESTVYKPVAVAVDNSGRIYVVSSTCYQGIISMTTDGVFTAFLGPQASDISFWDMIWRNIQTAEQRSQKEKNVSTAYNNINIDDSGFIYATTSSLSESKQLEAITSKSKDSTYAPVKMLNPGGEDVMKRNGFYPPSGEVNVNEEETSDAKITGVSKIIDVALGPDGVWSILDSKRQKIYTYNNNGELLYIFGDQGNQLGNLQNASAIDYLGTSIIALDKINKNITVYNRTEYGDLLAVALKHQNERQYSQTVEDWTEVLQRNSNFDMSYVSIGQSYYREGKYRQAMNMYKYAYDVSDYSDAYKELRKETISKVIILIPIAVIVICILLSKFLSYAAKVNTAAQSSSYKRNLWSEYCYGYHLIFHPFDGFWDIKHEKRATAKGATLILGFTVIAYIYNSIGKGYIINPTPKGASLVMSILSILMPVFLWILANWCLTTLFDGEGTMKDIYIATCYSLFPLPLFMMVATFASNFITVDEVSVINMITGIAYFWVGFLLFFGMLTIHDYSLGKNVLTSLGTIIGMAFIMFIGVLFSSLIGKIISFVYSIIVEFSYRI